MSLKRMFEAMAGASYLAQAPVPRIELCRAFANPHWISQLRLRGIAAAVSGAAADVRSGT